MHARLAKLYPQYRIAHMPSSLIQPQRQEGGPPPPMGAVGAERSGASAGAARQGGGGDTADCDEFVANAAVAGDAFAWHIDADPVGLGPSPWTDEHSTYCNGVPSLALPLPHPRFPAPRLRLPAPDDTSWCQSAAASLCHCSVPRQLPPVLWVLMVPTEKPEAEDITPADRCASCP